MSATSSDSEPVDMVIDLLSGSSASDWSGVKPETYAYFEIAQSERGPNDNQPPHLYVWNPTGGNISPISGDYTSLDETQTVEIQVWSLTATECKQYKQDLINYLALYGNDNEGQTLFHRIRPTTKDDLRSEKQARRTNHFVMTVEVDCRKLRDV